MTSTLAPVARGNRVVALDALRGMALFGILLVKVQYFQGPQWFLADSPAAVFEGADSVAAFLITARARRAAGRQQACWRDG
jgi:uncharacterized protein